MYLQCIRCYTWVLWQAAVLRAQWMRRVFQVREGGLYKEIQGLPLCRVCLNAWLLRPVGALQLRRLQRHRCQRHKLGQMPGRIPRGLQLCA